MNKKAHICSPNKPTPPTHPPTHPIPNPHKTYLHHAGVHLLLVVRRVAIGRDGLRAVRELRVSGENAHLLLLGKGALALLVPPVVELPLELLNPFLGGVVGGMGGPRGVVDEEGLVGRQRVLLLDVSDGGVGLWV